MEKATLIEQSKTFAIQVINICRLIKDERHEHVLVNQLLRSGTASVQTFTKETMRAAGRISSTNCK